MNEKREKELLSSEILVELNHSVYFNSLSDKVNSNINKTKTEYKHWLYRPSINTQSQGLTQGESDEILNLFNQAYYLMKNTPHCLVKD